MKKLLAITFLALAISPLLTGCKKDKEDPVITVNKPAEHSYVNLGEEFTVEATFEDDMELKNFTMKVGDVNGDPLPDFSYDQEGIISGTIYNYSASIPVSQTFSSDMFYLHFTVTDAEGKTTAKKHMLHIN